MKKKTSKKLLASVCALAAGCLCGGILASNPSANVSADPVNFSMKGAQVRMNEPAGLRFVSTIQKTYYDSFTNPVCGTLIIPTDKLTGENALTLDNVTALNIPAVNWLQKGNEYTEYMFAGVLVGSSTASGESVNYAALPQGYWNVSFSAVGYIHSEGDMETVSYTERHDISLAQTAAGALANGQTGETDFLKKICDTVVGDGLTMANTSKKAYLGDETIELKADLSGDCGLQTIWTSSDSSVATVDKDGKVTLHKVGTTTVTATIGTKSVSCALNVVDIAYDHDTGVISWSAVENATSYKVSVHKQHESDIYADYTFDSTTTSCNLWLKKGYSLITLKAFNAETELFTHVLTVNIVEPIKQSFGEKKAGTTNEYYIAEWSNPKEWGQFNQDGYTGGPEGSVTLSAGSGVNVQNSESTRIHDGYLHVDGGAWGDGSMCVNLPTSLNMSEIQSIKLKVKFTVTDNQTYPIFIFYYNVRDSYHYTNSSDNKSVTTETDSEGWTTYTIDSSVITSCSVAQLSKIYFGGNKAYMVDVQEITYVKGENLHDKSIPEGALFITDFFKGVTFFGVATVADVATNDESLSAVYNGSVSGAKAKAITYTDKWMQNCVEIVFNSPISFNVNTHSLVLKGATENLNNDTRYFQVAYNNGTTDANYQKDGIYSLNKNNYATTYGLTATNNFVTVEKIKIATSDVALKLWLDCLYLVKNSDVAIPEGATQIVGVNDSNTYTLSAKNGSWQAVNTLSTDGLGHTALVSTLRYSWNDAQQNNQFVNFKTTLDMTNYDTLYIAVGVGSMKDSIFYSYVRQGTNFCGFTVTQGNGVAVYSITKSQLEKAGFDITNIDGLSFSFKICTFYLGGVWVK